jgi:hypothetical protein
MSLVSYFLNYELLRYHFRFVVPFVLLVEFFLFLFVRQLSVADFRVAYHFLLREFSGALRLFVRRLGPVDHVDGHGDSAICFW